MIADARNVVWSRALSSPGRATGIAKWINSGKIGMDRERSSSVPLVLYKQKYTLQFDRQESLMSNSDDKSDDGKRCTLYKFDFVAMLITFFAS